MREVQKLSKVLEKKRHRDYFDEGDEAPASVGDIQEEDCLDDDVGYIFDLLRYA